MLTGAAAIRPGATASLGSSSRPARSISLTSGGRSIAQRFIASASGSSTRLTTNSPPSRMLLVVSLAPPRAMDAEAQHDQRRLLGDHVEEAEGRRIGAAVPVAGGDQRDRARHYEAAEQLVALRRRQLGEGEAHQARPSGITARDEAAAA